MVETGNVIIWITTNIGNVTPLLIGHTTSVVGYLSHTTSSNGTNHNSMTISLQDPGQYNADVFLSAYFSGTPVNECDSVIWIKHVNLSVDDDPKDPRDDGIQP